MKRAGRSHRELTNVVNATAEGYAFPTNLDSDQPLGSLAPPSQVDAVLAALAGDLSPQDLDTILDVARRGAGTTICAFYDGAVGPYISYIEKFRSEFEELIRNSAHA